MISRAATNDYCSLRGLVLDREARALIEDAIEFLIALLDEHDGDSADFEDMFDEEHDIADMEARGDDEVDFVEPETSRGFRTLAPAGLLALRLEQIARRKNKLSGRLGPPEPVIIAERYDIRPPRPDGRPHESPPPGLWTVRAEVDVRPNDFDALLKTREAVEELLNRPWVKAHIARREAMRRVASAVGGKPRRSAKPARSSRP